MGDVLVIGAAALELDSDDAGSDEGGSEPSASQRSSRAFDSGLMLYRDGIWNRSGIVDLTGETERAIGLVGDRRCDSYDQVGCLLGDRRCDWFCDEVCLLGDRRCGSCDEAGRSCDDIDPACTGRVMVTGLVGLVKVLVGDKLRMKLDRFMVEGRSGEVDDL